MARSIEVRSFLRGILRVGVVNVTAASEIGSAEEFLSPPTP
jgi:hypothetical protein